MTMQLHTRDASAAFVAQPSGIYVPRSVRLTAKPLVVDLFCGAGGFSCGFAQGGLHVAAASDHDYWAMQTYLWNLGSAAMRIVALDESARAALDKAIKKGWKEPYPQEGGRPLVRLQNGTYRMPTAGGAWRATQPDVPGCEVFYFGDVRRLTGTQICADLRVEVGEISAVIGGPPCQGYSMAGKRDVMDPRNSLVFEFARIISEVAPKLFLMENVVGIRSMVTPEGMPVLDAFCLALERGGYGQYEALRRGMASMPDARGGTRRSPERDTWSEAAGEGSTGDAPVQSSLFGSGS